MGVLLMSPKPAADAPMMTILSLKIEGGTATFSSGSRSFLVALRNTSKKE
jgi:hypothetical protein